MARRKRSEQARTAHATLEAIEWQLQAAVGRALRSFLARARVAAVRGLSPVGADVVLVAAVPAESFNAGGLPTLGEMTSWWAAEVDREITAAVYSAWQAATDSILGPDHAGSSLDAAAGYVARVRDRLVRGLVPPVAEDSFDLIRSTIAEGVAGGWSRDQVARRIAAELSWSSRSAYWRSEVARYDAQIDAILDPLGEPGSGPREIARAHDPNVSRLQKLRAQAVLKAEREEAYWRLRADRIAQTESTGAYNAGALNALGTEGWPGKTWLATGDGRTRPSHRSASGQTVALAEAFIVGGVSMQMPCDPSAPAREVVRCRCVVIGAETVPARKAS